MVFPKKQLVRCVCSGRKLSTLVHATRRRASA
eukprot:UN20792